LKLRRLPWFPARSHPAPPTCCGPTLPILYIESGTTIKLRQLLLSLQLESNGVYVAHERWIMLFSVVGKSARAAAVTLIYSLAIIQSVWQRAVSSSKSRNISDIKRWDMPAIYFNLSIL